MTPSSLRRRRTDVDVLALFLGQEAEPFSASYHFTRPVGTNWFHLLDQGLPRSRATKLERPCHRRTHRAQILLGRPGDQHPRLLGEAYLTAGGKMRLILNVVWSFFGHVDSARADRTRVAPVTVTALGLTARRPRPAPTAGPLVDTFSRVATDLRCR